MELQEVDAVDAEARTRQVDGGLHHLHRHRTGLRAPLGEDGWIQTVGMLGQETPRDELGAAICACPARASARGCLCGCGSWLWLWRQRRRRQRRRQRRRKNRQGGRERRHQTIECTRVHMRGSTAGKGWVGGSQWSAMSKVSSPDSAYSRISVAAGPRSTSSPSFSMSAICHSPVTSRAMVKPSPPSCVRSTAAIPAGDASRTRVPAI